jgi:ABC-type sulfate/molybdate transport systems ATPase subunit
VLQFLLNNLQSLGHVRRLSRAPLLPLPVMSIRNRQKEVLIVSGLVVRNLVKTLEGGAPGAEVLRGVGFAIAAGDCLGLQGRTGSGKTTLLRIIAGLLPLDAGEVRIAGELCSSPAFTMSPRERRIGFVFQNLGLWPHLTVRGHLDFVLSATPLSAGEKASRCAVLIDAFFLKGLEQRHPARLSGGERHLLALARALAGDIRLLLLDEPFTGLDDALKDRVLRALGAERERRGLTTLLITHDTGELSSFCPRFEKLAEGRIVEKNAGALA